MTTERLFFAAEIGAAWPEKLPEGRLLAEEFRHLTLAFLGLADRETLLSGIEQVPRPTWTLGPWGILNQWMFLPEKTPHVVAAHPLFLEGEKSFLSYQKQLSAWLLKQKFLKTLEPSFLPHVSVSRNPFQQLVWRDFPCQIPFFVRGIALYKSLGHSQYEILWHQDSLAPFEEIEHTADIAYHVRGKDFAALARHAVLALSFSFPAFSRYLPSIPLCHSLDEIVLLLNRWISEIDRQEGIGLKAVSYHAKIEGQDPLQWTMIVDV